MHFRGFSTVVVAALISIFASGLAAQASLETSEDDGLPVLLRHLPNWPEVRSQAVFARDAQGLVPVLGERPILELIDFSGGTEAAAAVYPAGKLLIVEYTNPQASGDADAVIKRRLAGSPEAGTVYKRIGNYNVFVFDATDTAAAEGLRDEVTYEKDIQWLGDNPFLISAERAFVITITDIFLSTLLTILIGIGVAIVGGSAFGYLYFRVMERRRRLLRTYSDGGGMVRLNLDGFTPDVNAKHS